MSKKSVISVSAGNKSFKKVDKAQANIRSLVRNAFRISKQTDFLALSDLNFTVQEGEVFGIVGHNGSGKSTLLNCIIGAMRFDKGSEFYSEGKILKLSLGMGFDPNLSGRENIYVNGSVIGLTFKRIGEIFEDIVSFSGLEKFIDSPVKSYSRGMRSRLMFAIAIHADADIFLFDEFFGGVGDIEFKKKSQDVFNRTFLNDRTLIIVSHNLEVIQKYCDRVMILDKGKQVAIGKPMEMVEAYKALYE